MQFLFFLGICVNECYNKCIIVFTYGGVYMKEILIKALKGLALAVVFGGFTYFWSKNLFTAGLMAAVMFLSMFIPQKRR